MDPQAAKISKGRSRSSPVRAETVSWEDAIEVYRHLLQTMPGTDIILAGDSAGGGIAAAMMHKLQDLCLRVWCMLGSRSLSANPGNRSSSCLLRLAASSSLPGRTSATTACGTRRCPTRTATSCPEPGKTEKPTKSCRSCRTRPPDLVEFCASMTRGDLPHNDWQHSPVFAPGPLHEIPPTLVVYGEDGA